MASGKLAGEKSQIVRELPEACSDERKAVEFMERQRWGDRPACTHCGSTAVYQMRDRRTGERNARFLWRCRNCGRQFTVRVGTVFEDSPILLRHWCFAFWAACSSKKGVSALQIKRQTGLSYKSALFMMHRIRYAMADDASTPRQLTGTVEVDETYIGGRPRYRSASNPRGRATKKAPVMALIERGGEVRPIQVERLGSREVQRIVRQHVHASARLMTDEERAYRRVGREFQGGHQAIMHSVGEYVRGEAYTNTAESFFALLKRGIVGTFHSVSRRHLHRYLAEFQYRYNTRRLEDGERTAIAIRKAVGKRLMYRQSGP